MKYWKGYGHFFRTKNPKSPIRPSEFEPIRDDFGAHLEEIEAEMREFEGRVLKVAGPRPRPATLALIVVGALAVIVMSSLQVKWTDSTMVFYTNVLLIVMMLIVIIQQIGRYLRSKEKSVSEIDAAVGLARRYYHYHRPMVLEAEIYDEYLQHLRMANASDFEQIMVPDRS